MHERMIYKSSMISMELLEVRVESRILAVLSSMTIHKTCTGTQIGTNSGQFLLSKPWLKFAKMLVILAMVLNFSMNHTGTSVVTLSRTTIKMRSKLLASKLG